MLQFLQERLSEDPGLYRNDLIAAWIHQLFLVFSVSEAEAAGIELAQRLGTAEPLPDTDCRELLERGLSVNAVAEQTGFSSPQSFIRVFKASVGCTPGQYRKQNK